MGDSKNIDGRGLSLTGRTQRDRNGLTVNNAYVLSLKDITITQMLRGISIGVTGATLTTSGKVIIHYNIQNSGYNGAGILSRGNATFTGELLQLSSNTAADNGGGMAVQLGTSTFRSDSTIFTENKAGGNGGGLYLASSSITTFDGKDVSFLSNIGGNMGGAVYIAESSKLTFDNSGVLNFSSNTAVSGGALAALNISENILFKKGQTNFYGNYTNSAGGAIYLDNASLDFTDTILFSSGNYSATTSNYSTTRGGFLYANRANVYFGHSSFMHNYTSAGTYNSTKRGGALYGESGTYFGFEGDVKFEYNRAVSGEGGAIYLNGSSADFTGGSTVFNANTANTGGAMYVTGATVSFTGQSVEFSSNTAGTGAVVYGENSNITFGATNTYFYGNSSSGGNGIIAIGSGLILDFSNTILTAVGNKSSSGGFLFLNGNSLDFNKDVTMERNETTSASGVGGAMQLSAGSNVNFKGSSNIFRSNKVNSGNSGGAIYVNGSNAHFYGNLTKFEDNNITMTNSYGGGGALYIIGTSSVSFNSTETEFTGNYTTGIYKNGGAISLSGDSSLSFNGKLKVVSNYTAGVGGFLWANAGKDMTFSGSVEFSSNTAGSGGAIYLTGSRNILFTGATAEVNYNMAGNGGAFYLTGASGSALTFDTVLTATGNYATSGSGGFMYIQSSTASFKKNTDIVSSYASGAGGAIYASGSNIAFSGTNTNFKNNISSNTGGAIYAMSSSLLDFSGTYLKAEYNVANSGGFMQMRGSTVNFGEAEIKNNRSSQMGGSGGALGMLSSAIANFNGLMTSFTENRSTGYGGAISINDSTANFYKADAVFSNNESGLAGGAIYLTGAAKLKFDSNATGSLFSNNKATLNGGAVAVTGGAAAEFYNAVFQGNQSVSGYGGAVSIEGTNVNMSSVSFISRNVSGSSTTLFYGNTASGQSNAVYLGNFSNTYFIAGSSSSIEMHDRMSGSATGNTNSINMYFSGEGNFNLYADALVSNANVKISGSNGGTFNLYNGSNFTAKTLTNDENSIIKMNSDDKNTMTLSKFVNNGELEMTAALYEGEDNTDSDQILVSGNVDLGANSILKVTLKHSRFIEKEFHLIQYGGTLSGEFGEVIFNERVAFATATINYGSRFNDWITVAMRGKGKGTNFSEISGLSRNQFATAVTYDALSLISEDNTDLDDVITAIDSLNNDAAVKDALNQASGYFLANVIRSAAFGGDSGEIYNRILDSSQYDFANSGLWAQAKANSVTNKADENSPEDYSDTIIGMMIGYDRYFSGNSLMFGAYGKFDMHNIKQDPGNKADITSLGLGVYGGYIKEKWELKGLLSGNFDSYTTEREITFLPVEDRKAEADFGGTTIGFDLEGAYKIDVNDDIQFRPYAGLEVRSVSYDEIKESGAQSLNLTVDSGSYGRMAARFGAGINRKHNVYGWYVNGEYKQLFSGELPEIDNTFEGYDEKFTIVGSEEGQGALGIKAGGSYNIAENLIIYANVSYFTAERYDNIYGNLGVRWMMFSGTDEKVKHIKKDKDITGSLIQKQAKRQEKIEQAEDTLMYEEDKLTQLNASLIEKRRFEQDMQEEAKIAVREAQRAEDSFYSLADTGLTPEELSFEEKEFKDKLKEEKEAVKAFNNAEKDTKKTEKDIEKQTEKVRKAEARLAMLKLQAQEKEKQELEKQVKSEYMRYEKETAIDEKAVDRETERELRRLQKEEKRIKKEEMKLAEMQAKKAADEEKKKQKRIAAEQTAIQTGIISDFGKEEAKIAKEQAARERAAMKELEKAEKELLREEKLIEKEREKMRKEEERLIALQAKMLEDDARKKEQSVKAEAKKKKPEVTAETAEKAKEQQKIEAEIAAYEASLAAEKVKNDQKAAREAAAKKKADEEKKRKEQERIQKEKEEAKKQPGELSDADLDKRAKEAAARRFKKVQKAFDLKFTPNNYKLVETAKMTIREQIEEIKKLDYKKIIIEGHTDSEEAGSYEASKDLSRMRAEAVYNEFIANGIPKDKIDFAGLADKFPISDNKTDRGKIDNRRVEIVVE